MVLSSKFLLPTSGISFLALSASELVSSSFVLRVSVCLCVCPSVSALTFSLNIFFSETTYRISMKFHRIVPAMVLFRIFFKEFDSFKHSGCCGNKTKKFLKSLKIFLSETIRLRATNLACSFTLWISIKFLQIIALGSNLAQAWGSQVLHGII